MRPAAPAAGGGAAAGKRRLAAAGWPSAGPPPPPPPPPIEAPIEPLDAQFSAGWLAEGPPSSAASLVDCDEHRKQSHCEIEKRRRDKMNHYIMQLASVIPPFTDSQSGKFDKLTILRMAVHHVKSLRSSLCSFSSFHLRPSFLSSGNLLKNLILQMAGQEVRDNLFMVVTCDRARVLFVSESSRDILNQDQHELVGQCLFDLLHKDDVGKVKEQILQSGAAPRQMLVDSKTMQPIKLSHHRRHQSFSQLKGRSSSTPQPGARRSFFCRMRTGSTNHPAGCSSAGPAKPAPADKPRTDTTGASQPLATKTTTDNTQTTNKTPAKRRGFQHEPSGSSSSASSSEHANNKDGASSSGIGSCEGATSSSGEQSAGSSSGGGAGPGAPHLPKKLAHHHHHQHHQHHSNYGRAHHKRKNWRYIVMHCTGYLKSITLKSDEFDEDDYESLSSDHNQSDEEESYGWRTINCLVVVCRRSPFDRDLKPDRPLTFTCRYSMDGKFMFVDQRTTMALGYTPQQLLGTSHYAYCHKDSVNTFKECHRQSILKSEPVSSDIYQFKRANGQNLWLQTSLKSFRNPWTKFIDYIIASHTTAEGGNQPLYNEGCVPTKFNRDLAGGGGGGSQSSSPSSSLSLLSTDGKKSTCSSSMASSYSLESYSSGGNIQALLNKIDRVRPNGSAAQGGDAKKKKSSSNNNNSASSDDNNQLTSPGRSSSTRKSQDDTGNYSDLQSCSSQSSQNSAGADFGALNRNSSINCFTGDGLEQTGAPVNQQVAPAGMPAPTIEPVDQGPPPPPPPPPPMSQPTSATYYHPTDDQKLSVFPCTVQEMCLASQPPGGCHQIIQVEQQQASGPMQQVHPVEQKLQTQPFVIQSVVARCPMQTVISQQPIGAPRAPPQQMAATANDRYLAQMVPMNAYPSVSPLYKVDVSSLAQQRVQSAPMVVEPSLSSGGPQQIVKVPQQLMPAQQGPAIGMPQMMWTPARAMVQQEPGSMANQAYHQVMCAPQQHHVVSEPELVALTGLDEAGEPQLVLHQAPPQHQQQQQQQQQQQLQIQCQQCANHKFSMQPLVTIGNSTDLSDITSLAVDEELDEEQLLEYLAGCDSGPQLYYTQNNAFP